ncbi:MAG TPA: hypothetical protein VGJ00_09835 [Rhabdochlamydiaceae bacterium]|jgi:hypothetical protein
MGLAEENDIKQVLVLTVPKSGSYLIKKALELITQKQVKIVNSHQLKEDQFPLFKDNAIGIQHIYLDLHKKTSAQGEKYIKILHVRDPRDVLVSLREWLYTQTRWFKLRNDDWNTYTSLSSEEKLQFLITLPDERFSTRYFFRKAIEWIEDPTVLVSRFEELVGPQGGGDRLLQENAIRALARHIRHPLDDQAVAYVADHLFGETLTFYKGQIGSWKKHFNLEHKQLCKQYFSDELYKLGYATDNNW